MCGESRPGGWRSGCPERGPERCWQFVGADCRVHSLVESRECQPVGDVVSDVRPVRITTPHIPLPSAENLEDLAIPSADRIYETVAKSLA
ncbi:hypothetical protein BH23ACT5_BH23ACT5_19450 [soil metagenome]